MTSPVITSMRARSQQPQQNRTVVIDHKPISVNGENVITSSKISDNRVISSKYTSLNFLPKNLFEQFRRIANFYFLCIAVIQVTTNSPVSPITSLAPLFFVVTTTALKQGYEDWLRHKTDRAINNRPFPVLKNDKLVEIKSEAIRVGDVVVVTKEEEIPCDLVVIACNDPEGKCHVTTANLDGETNLKVRESLPATKMYQKVEDIKKLNGVIMCEKPNTDLYNFVGNITLEENGSYNTYPLGPSNLLIRGSRLKNTEYVFGVAVYTGIETKLALNSRLTSNKFSTVEKTVNKYLIVYLLLLVVSSFSCTVLKFLYRDDPTVGTAWYLRVDADRNKSMARIVFEDFLAFFVIYNYVIPISLYVTLEMVKFFGSKTLVNDPYLFDDELCEKPRCNSSDLNEELGQVEYLFSDKTGTLTENEMIFRSCSVEGIIYDEVEGKLVGRLCKSNLFNPTQELDMRHIEPFLLAIVLCNTVQVNKIEVNGQTNEQSSEYEYLADSPDEKALVEACQKFGMVLVAATDKACDILMGQKVRQFKKHYTMEFDSTRKRMSVVIEDDAGKLYLITKGAESELISLINQGKVNETFQHIDDYARHGLRTLVIAWKDVSKEEFIEMENLLKEAANTIEDRKVAVTASYIKCENKLKLLGATAVEDRLQDGVPESIADMKSAGIKIWVLTGDKLETAISVAYSCNLLDSEMTQMILARQADDESCGECIKRYVAILNSNGTLTNGATVTRYALIVDGRSLHMAMKSHIEVFKEICMKCVVVLCCRMSPIQKGNVVSMVKNSKNRPVTAAIGDGANDVSMIQEAHVGFGLMGKEGRQAVNSCDFAFAKFKFVTRILLVHGNLFYHRVSTLIHYFFYKNVIFVTPQFLFSFYNAFSSQTIYHGVLLMLYNMIFTATPVLIYGIVERHIPTEALMNNPALYKNIAKNKNMRFIEFLKWFLNGAFHGLIIYYFYSFVWESTSQFSNGQTFGLFAFGTTLYHGVIIVANFKLGLITHYWTIYFTASIVLSLLAAPTFCSIYSAYRWGLFNDDLYGIYYELMISFNFWFALVLVGVLALLPDFVHVVMKNTLESIQFSNFFERRGAHVTPEQNSHQRY